MAYRQWPTADTNLMLGLQSDGLQHRVPPENPPGLRLLLRTLDESRSAEFILSLCPGGVNGCHFVTVNPQGARVRSRDGGIPFTPGHALRRHQSPTAVTDRLISAGVQCFLRPRRRSAGLIGPPRCRGMTRGCWEAVRKCRRNVGAPPRRNKSLQINSSPTATLK